MKGILLAYLASVVTLAASASVFAETLSNSKRPPFSKILASPF
jgi:hypothetical protein